MAKDKPNEPLNGPASAGGVDPIDAAWADLADAVVVHLRTMTDPEERDFLILQVEGPEDEVGGQPYVQFAGYDDGHRVRGEISGPRVVRPEQRPATEGLGDALRKDGWDETDETYFLEVGDAGLAGMVTTTLAALRETFRVPHPSLLTYVAEGPSAVEAQRLGLTAADDLVREPDLRERPRPVAVEVHDRDHLRFLVDQHLRDRFGVTPEVRNGMMLVRHDGLLVRVKVAAPGVPIVISTCVVEDVQSRHQACVELALMNGRSQFFSWGLRGRQVWPSTTVWAQPFVADHLDLALRSFLRHLKYSRDDVRLRLGRRPD